MTELAVAAYAPPHVLSAADYHLASRFSFGVNASLVKDIRKAGGSHEWFAKQLKPSKVSDKRAKAIASWFPRLHDSAPQAWANIKQDRYSAWEYGSDLVSFTLSRKIVTRRQVHEVMSDFWSNLLYIPAYEDRSTPWRYSYDTMIRKYALTSFTALLQHAVVHPAMSGWLTNSNNVKTGINENLGRELLELFTVGRPAGYTEKDVKNSARILTGFKVAVFDGFQASYSPSDHYTGRISVLGFTHANSSPDGRPAVQAYLKYLARHPSTAQRIAKRLCVRFVSDHPSKAIVKAVKKAYLRSGTDIKATLKALIKHRDFKRAARKKIRTPVEDLINSSRVLGIRPTRPTSDKAFARQMTWMCASMGQHQFRWPRPDGFPEVSTTWASPARILRSWNIHYSLGAGWWDTKNVVEAKRTTYLPKKWPRTLAQITDHQARMLLGAKASVDVRKAVASILDEPPSRVYKSAKDVEEWKYGLIRGTIMNAPKAMLR
ncbi:hypothetical protein BH09ACT10_BH09ACT10_08610 [soil metagenome]